jgi:hypothetical protein
VTPLTVQRAISQLRRDRFELACSIPVRALADDDPVVIELYAKLQQIDESLSELDQMYNDLIYADVLGKQGAAAVIEACRIIREAKP